jgi:hypothetical protein
MEDKLIRETHMRGAAAVNAVALAMAHRGTDVWTDRDHQTVEILKALLADVAKPAIAGVVPSGLAARGTIESSQLMDRVAASLQLSPLEEEEVPF